MPHRGLEAALVLHLAFQMDALPTELPRQCNGHLVRLTDIGPKRLQSLLNIQIIIYMYVGHKRLQSLLNIQIHTNILVLSAYIVF